MSYQDISKAPEGKKPLGRVEVTDKRGIDAYTRGPLGAMGHVISDSARTFFGEHEEYRGLKIGVMPEAGPSDKKPPEAKLFIAFYDLSQEPEA